MIGTEYIKLCYNNRFATLATGFLRSSGRVIPPLGAGRSPTDEFKNVK